MLLRSTPFFLLDIQVRSLSTLVTNHELIPVLLDLIDVTLAYDDGNSRLIDGFTRIMLITSNNG